MEELYALAAMGNMWGVRDRAISLANPAPGYSAFAKQADALAATFQEDELLVWLDTFLK